MTRVPRDAGEGPQWNPHTPTAEELADVFAEERAVSTYTGWHVPGWPKTGPRSDATALTRMRGLTTHPGVTEPHTAPLVWQGDDN